MPMTVQLNHMEIKAAMNFYTSHKTVDVITTIQCMFTHINWLLMTNYSPFSDPMSAMQVSWTLSNELYMMGWLMVVWLFRYLFCISIEVWRLLDLHDQSDIQTKKIVISQVALSV